jgi:glycosyltransferase involved in cell wall biosynthesis
MELSMHRVLMISATFPPFNVSGSQRAFQFAKYLPEYGYLPSVVSAEPGPMDPVDPSLLEQLDGRIRLERIQHLAPKIKPLLLALLALLRPVARCVRALLAAPADEPKLAAAPTAEFTVSGEPTFPSESVPLLGRMWHTMAWLFNFHVDIALPMLQRAVKINLREPVDLVWVTGPSSCTLLVGYWASRLLRKPLVLDIRDPWTYGSLWLPFSRLTAACEKKWARTILTAASRTVFASPLTMATMQERYPGEAATKMCTITNGHTGEVGVSPLRSAPEEKCLMSYTGSLNPRRRPDVLLDALQRVSRDPEVADDLRLQFVGGMAGHEAKIAAHGVQEQVLDVGQVSHNESLGYMRGADVNLLLQTITAGRDVIAGKTFEYLAARKPIIGVVAPDGGDAWLLRETGGGSVVAFDDPGAVADEMLRLWKLWKNGMLADSVAQVDIEAYSRRRLTGDLVKLLDEVVRR